MVDKMNVSLRNYQGEIDENDPLFELTRIMGVNGGNAVKSAALEPASSEPVPVAPELVELAPDEREPFDDNFSLDLEQELELAPVAEISLDKSEFDLDEDFNASFNEELANFAPEVTVARVNASSLEDDLNALLMDEPARSLDNGPVLDTASLDKFSLNEAFDDPDFATNEVVAADQFDAPLAIETISEDFEAEDFEAEDFEVEDFEVEDLTYEAMAGAAVPAAPEPVLQSQFTTHANRIFGRSNPTRAQDAPEVVSDFDDVPGMEDLSLANNGLEFGIDRDAQGEFTSLEVKQEFEAEQEFASTTSLQELESDPFADLADFDFDPAPMPLGAAPTLLGAAPAAKAFERQVSGSANSAFESALNDKFPKPIELAPTVDAADFNDDFAIAMNDLEVPDFDISDAPTNSHAPDINLDDDFADEYQGFEKAIAQSVAVPAFEAAVLDDDTDIDFEEMLNDELTASIDNDDHQNEYLAGAAATVAGAALYRTQQTEYRNQLPNLDEGNGQFPPLRRPVVPMQSKKNWMPVAALGALLLMGGAGYYAISGQSTSATGSAPTLVKADPNPVKVVPEVTEGKVVANQDQSVYDKVGGQEAVLPNQGQLVSESEEPVDIAAVATSDVVDPNAKSEERIDPALDPAAPSGQAADTLAIAPRKVRTMIVKPDGSLVERPAEVAVAAPQVAVPQVAVPEVAVAAPLVTPEAPDVAPVAQTQSVAEVAPIIAPQITNEVAKVAEPSVEIAKVEGPIVEVAKVADPIAEIAKIAEPAQEQPAAKKPTVKVVKVKKIKPPVIEPEIVAEQDAADSAPVLEERPADQPVNIIGKTGKAAANADTQVAAVDAKPSASGSYSVQIASTPSPEAAKSTYAALSRKFGDVLGGRGVNVQKADVAGKGTVYRVRIPAGSKQEAAALCEQYKAAGGNCFISR